jgi:putative nucleotidyltransferase with HDIG domain
VKESDDRAVIPDPALALRARIEQGALELPLLPDVAAEVLSLSASDVADARKLADLVHRDQTLAGSVLRIANSPGYAGRGRIVSLQQAVSRLGFTALREIAFAASVQARCFRIPGFENETRALWRHALACAVVAREIARSRRRNVETAFLCGLLHDVGKPVLLQALADIGKGASAESLALIDERHPDVGGALALGWSLPAAVTESIAHHHRPSTAPSCPEAAAMTHLADAVAHRVLAEPGPDPHDPEVSALLNLYTEAIEARS